MVVAVQENVESKKGVASEGLPQGDIVELRAKSQITIPKKLLKQVGMEEGDSFEVVAVNGEIRLIPVVIYPKRVVERWQREFERARQDWAGGKATAYDSVDQAIDELEDEYGIKNTADGWI